MGDPGLGVSRPSNHVTAREVAVILYSGLQQSFVANSIQSRRTNENTSSNWACYLANLCPLLLDYVSASVLILNSWGRKTP